MRKFWLAILALLLGGTAAHAKTLDVDTKRLIRVEGVVAGNAVAQGQQVLDLAAKSTAPIYILLNSPGGSVLAGLQLVNAVHMAQSRGIKIKCFVTNTAMSMAFYFLTQCDERYAFRYSLLLWHPVRIGMMGGFTADELQYFANDVAQLEAPMIEEIFKTLTLDRTFFMYHYRYETVWTAEKITEISPGFLTVVEDITNVPGLFKGAVGGQEDQIKNQDRYQYRAH